VFSSERLDEVGTASAGYHRPSRVRLRRPLGLLDLRTTLADQLRRSRAVDAPASNVVIQSGIAGALRLIAQSLRQLGVETVAFEDPCLPFLPSILRRAGLATEPVPVDGSGLRVDLLEATEATAVLVTPAHQYPTGVPLAPDRRLQLIGWATRRHGWIIEDDYDGEFRYDRRSIGSLQALAPDRVIYLGTASKSVAAGMRTAWAVLPDAVLATIAPAVAGDVSGLEQATFADFVATCAFDRHLRAMRKLYTARRRVLVNALADAPFDLTVLGIPAGLHVPVAWDRDGPDEASLVAAGEEVGMGLIGFGAHFANQTSRAAACPGMVLGFSRQPETGYSNSVERLMELLARFGSA
jgi:GntR family transcriptional regulator / MocR family aminotransferase